MIQDYFRRFKKKKETRLAVERMEAEEDLTVSLQVQFSTTISTFLNKLGLIYEVKMSWMHRII